MRTLRLALPFAAFLSILSLGAFADMVTLKTGERVEGKIIEDNDNELKIVVQVSPAISDERTIPKGEIAKVSKVAPDEEAYRLVMNIQTGPNSLAPAQYAQVIDRLKAYVKQYPASLHAIDIQQTINAFAAEKKRSEAGEVKLNGEWLTKEQAQKERVQIGGVFRFEEMKSHSAAGDLMGALNTFAALEKNDAGARTYPDAVELAKQILVRLKPTVEQALLTQKVVKAEKEKGWAAAKLADRAEMIAAYKREQAQAEAAAVVAEHAGGWPPLVAGSERCLKAIETKIPTELTRLSNLPVANMRSSVELADTAIRQISAVELPEAKESLKQALLLWPANELAKRKQEDLAKAPAPAPAEVVPPPPAATPAPVKRR